MIVLFTDFGVGSPYMGQMRAVLARSAPAVPVIDLFADAPLCEPRLSAYLLAAYCEEFPAGTVFLCVVDPGVGGARRACVLRADERWYVGPDNGLLNVVAMRARELRWMDLEWRPERLSASFHGRDLFAPVAAELAQGRIPAARAQPADARVDRSWPQELPRILYVDRFGNAMTGVRAERCGAQTLLRVHASTLARAHTFSSVAPGEAFWYANANGLVEIAVNRGRADLALGLTVGDTVQIIPPV
jgi:S-adenosylmethionine hydrolase